MGRRLYETMLFWETADQDPSLDDTMLEWAAMGTGCRRWCSPRRWRRFRATPRLATASLVEEIGRWRAERGHADIAVGGATLAGQVAASGLIDEYRVRVYPVLVGGGTPFFSHDERRVDLELVYSCTFRSASSTSATAWLDDLAARPRMIPNRRRPSR